MSKIRQLAGQTAIYGLSSIIGRLLNYLLVPIYTRIFLPAEYGIVTEIYAYVAFFIVILTYGMETSFFRFSEKNKNNNSIFTTSSISLAVTSIVFIIIATVFRQPLAEMLKYPNNAEYITWFALIVGLDAFTSIPFARLRMLNKAKKFALIKLLNIFINIAFNLFFLILCPQILKGDNQSLISIVNLVYNPETGVGYIFISNLIASIITVLALLPDLLRQKFTFDKVILKKMLIYGAPLLIAGLAGVVNETIDRALLKYLLPESIAMHNLGIYGACYKVAILMSIFIQAYRYAAEPFFFAQSKEKDSKKTYSQMMTAYIIVSSIIFVGIMMYIDQVMLFVGVEYREGAKIVPILLMANLFLGIFYNLSVWYKINDKTRYGAFFALFGALITLILNIILIPKIGYMGSAWATLICYFSMTLISYFYGRKKFKIPYNVKKIALHTILAIGVYLLTLIIPYPSVISKIIINTILLIIFIIFVFILNKTIISNILLKRKNES